MLKKFDQFINENNSTIPIGSKVQTNMGIKKSGTVIPWFNWRQATDGTYSEPDKDDYVAIQFDDGTKGFSAISYLSVLNPDTGDYNSIGELIDDEEYDTTGEIEKIAFKDNNCNFGWIEFEDGTSDGFTIFPSGKIAFDKWYPEEKYNMLVQHINNTKSIKMNKNDN